jgi:hypothetical protein
VPAALPSPEGPEPDGVPDPVTAAYRQLQARQNVRPGERRRDQKGRFLPVDNQFRIEYRNCKTPTDAFVQVSHYAIRFWRVYLGPAAWDLWLVLCSYEYFVQNHGEKWPKLAHLARMVGLSSSSRKTLKQAIDDLEAAQLLRYTIENEGTTGAAHLFTNVIRMGECPVLTAVQEAKLDPQTVREHRHWLEHYPRFDFEAWQAGSSHYLRDCREAE